MPVLIYGGFYSESVEKRRRRRYAVLSATFAQDYRPSDPEIIGHHQINVNTQDYDVVFEWLEANLVQYDDDVTAGEDGDTKERPRVLLLWLNEGQFQTNQLEELRDLIQSLLADMAPEVKEVDVNLIGPSGSKGLRNMIAEVSELIKKTDTDTLNGGPFLPAGWDFSIYSPVATASAKLILGDNDTVIRNALGISRNEEIGAASKNNEETNNDKEKCGYIDRCRHRYGNTRNYTSLYLMEQAFKQIGISFFRTIAPDRQLLKEITSTEFKYRGIDFDDPDEAIVLVSERDTFYGRSLPTALLGSPEDEENKSGDDELDLRDEEESSSRRFQEADTTCRNNSCRQYVYMRGLDGEILTATPLSPQQSANGREQEVERAVGVNRYDYLRRLAQDIRNDFSNTSQTVRAVGVLGSDLYDKLLILQALRSDFADALFFTTDVDARFLHPAEMNWTRGLIVASSYGLSLNLDQIAEYLCIPPHHRELPPFRDSYQTSVYLATQLALARAFGNDRNCDSGETSNGGTTNKDKSSPPTDRRVTLEECLSIDDSQYDPDDRLRCTLAAFTAPKFFEVGTSKLVSLTQPRNSLADSMFGPPNFSSPRTLGSYLVTAGAGAILLCGIFAFVSPRRTRYLLALGLIALALPGGEVLRVDYLDGVEGEPLPVFSGSSVLPTVYLIWLTAILAAALLIYAHWDLKRTSRKLAGRFNLSDQAKWSRHLPPPWKKPECRSWPEHVWKRWVREQMYLVLALMHAAFSVLLVWVFSDFSLPIRGQATCISYVTGVALAVYGFFLLIYFLVDEARRCGLMVRDLLSKECRQVDSSLDEYVRAQRVGTTVRDATRTALQRWRGARYLAEKTEELENIVYYPFAILLMLILSHSAFFDNWRIAPSVVIVLGTGVLINVVGMLLLRAYVAKLRESAVSSLREVRVNEQKAEHQALQTIIADVGSESRGAFRPLGKDTILKAPLIPLGGYGSLYLVDYFLAITR